MTDNPDPAMVALFDQTVAGVNETLTIFTQTYREGCTQFRYEETLAALAALFDKRSENKAAVCQYLAIAVKRIVELEDTITRITGEISEMLTENT